MESNQVKVTQQRPSSGFLPSVWTPEFIQSIQTPYSKEGHGKRLDEVKQGVKDLLEATKSPQAQLSLIDKLQHLGLSGHFEKEIKETLHLLHQQNMAAEADDLYTVALQFRLLRSNGFSISSDVFNKFIDKDGKFVGEDELKENVDTNLSLYEASFLGTDEETVLQEAIDFTTRNLRSIVEKSGKGNHISNMIQQSLDVPLHWRLPYTEARNYINIYQNDETANGVLLELAKLNYNVVQSVYLKELQELAEWRMGYDYKEILEFSRDRLIECYFCGMGYIPDLQFSKYRKIVAKSICVATALDDIYDIYGTLDQLEKLTDTIKRWEPKAKVPKELPNCMKVCYSTIYDHVEELVDNARNDIGMDILPYIKEQWACFAGACHEDARWLAEGYMPTFDEYLQNGWKSIGSPGAMTYAFFGALDKATILKYLPHCIEQWSGSELFYWSGLIARLNDDIKPAKVEIDKGEETNSIKCFMVQEGVTEEEAQARVRALLVHAWRKLNRFLAENCLPLQIVTIALNNARIFQRMYQDDDWFGDQTKSNKETVISSFFQPFPI